MANVCYPNYAPATTSDTFSVIWKLSRAMKKAGWTYKASGDGTNKDVNGNNGGDKWGTSADPSSDTYTATLSTGSGCWWCAEGPGTVRVAITAAPTGTFIRGERVTQVDGSEGEFQGYVINAAGNAGWAIIRLRSAKSTWTGTGTVTGATSGATLTPSATPKIFVRQVVFWKSTTNLTNGSIYYICADQSGESASLFSTLAANVDCSATIAPGGKAVLNSGNNLPTLAVVINGQNTSVLSGAAGSISHASWFSMSSSLGNAQIAALDATTTTGSSGTSADATFWVTLDQSATPGSQSVIGFFILDDTEQGDVDGYAWFRPTSSTWTYAYTGSTNSPGTLTSSLWNGSGTNGTSGSAVWLWNGYCARGSGTAKDLAAPFFGNLEGAGTPNILSTSATVSRVANHPDGASAPILRVPFVLWCDMQDRKIRKGVPRWMAFAPVGSALDTYDTKQWLCLTTLSSTTTPVVLVGKYDGITTPLP